MKKAELKLKTDKLLGFRLQDAEKDQQAKLGAKVGGKIGDKTTPVKLGAKVGGKAGTKTV